MGNICVGLEDFLWEKYTDSTMPLRIAFTIERYRGDREPFVYDLPATKERLHWLYVNQDNLHLNDGRVMHFPLYLYETVMRDLTDLEYLVEVPGNFLIWCPYSNRDVPLSEWFRVNGRLLDLSEYQEDEEVEEWGEREIELSSFADGDDISSIEEDDLVLVTSTFNRI